MFKMVNIKEAFNSLIASKFRHFQYSTVIRVVDEEYEGMVYNLSIDGDETFIADCVVVHNCRSTTIPDVKDEYNLAKKAVGKRPSVGASGAEEVGGRTTYGGWLKKQPVEFIDEALGVERSRLFRSGKLTIDKFLDPTGRVYTLDQLKAMNPFVFAE